MERTELERQMTARVWRHMITSFGGFVGVIVLMGVSGAAAQLMFGNDMPVVVRVLPLLGILAIPAIGFYSTFKNLRCPSCNRLVIWEVSWNYSLFSRMAPKTCGGCGKKIFPDDLVRRMSRAMLVLVGVGVVLGALSAGLGAMSANRAQDQAARTPAAAPAPR